MIQAVRSDPTDLWQLISGLEGRVLAPCAVIRRAAALSYLAASIFAIAGFTLTFGAAGNSNIAA